MTTAVTNAASSSAAATTEKSKADEAKNKLSGDLDNFLNLLVTQLKHQDPLDPMDATESTNQLVQFSLVEQTIAGNKIAEETQKIISDSLLSNLVNYVGLDARAETNQLPLHEGKGEFTYVLDKAAHKVTVSIVNSKGSTVFSTQGETKAGAHKVEWDGKDQSGNQLPDGTYTIRVTPVNAKNDAMDVTTVVKGHVTGVAVEGDKPTLFMGDLGIAMDKIIGVSEPKKTSTANEAKTDTEDKAS